MSSSTCPRSCGLLSASAIFIAVGIVQLLSGIILLKSDHIYMLAGTDFIASVSNIIVGCLLGMSASSWESKMKRISMKNASRRNVLAGLYISVVAINVTAAIIMITGDGNSLLTALAETPRSTSAKFVGEILASAYVISVCSPIVCIVVGIVCLSGNRLELREDLCQSGKKKNKSISNTESYGCAFKHRPKLMSDYNSQSPSFSKTSPGDSVFVDNKRLANSSLTSEKSLKLWAQKRKKILEEITSHRFSLFSDNYLQFPEFSYDSYAKSMLPRVKLTALTRPHSETSSLDYSKYGRSTSTNKLLNETCTKNDSPTKKRRATINRSHQITKNVDTNYLYNFVDDSTKISLINSQQQALPNTEQFASCSENDHKILHSSSDINWQNEYCNDSKRCFNNEGTEFGDVFDYPNDTSIYNGTRTKSDTHSVTFDFDPENLTNDSEINLTINPLEFSTVSEIKSKLMKSFKTISEKEHKLVRKSQSAIPRTSYLSEEMFPFSGHRQTITPETMAGEIIPINIRNVLTSKNISISADELGNSKNEEIVNDELRDAKFSYSKLSLNDVQLSTKDRHFTNEGKEKFNRELNELQPITQTKERLKKLRNSSSVTESTQLKNVNDISENCSNPYQVPTNEISNHETLNAHGVIKENANTETFAAETECENAVKSRSRKQSTIRYPRIFTGYPIDTDGKTDISNLIMDADSLLGLSDEELLNRTGRIRQLRKSVEVRSKERKSMSIHSNGEE